MAESKRDSKEKAPESKGGGRKARPRAPVPAPKSAAPAPPRPAPKEIGGRKGPDPTRYGDWEKKGRCIDF